MSKMRLVLHAILWARDIKRRTGLAVLVLAVGLLLIPAMIEGFPPASLPPTVGQPVPTGELGEIVRLGKELVERTNTHPLTKPYVGNDLQCSSCHLHAGTDPKVATFIGVASAYPLYSTRHKAVITLEERVGDCFMRSLNGIRPPLGSKPSVAITTYITWLSTGYPGRMNPNADEGLYAFPVLPVGDARADAARGEKTYRQKCSNCHNFDGQGVPGDIPPVWGTRSYNAGAGLAEIPKLAGWLKAAMPLGDAGLTDEEALDIAAYVDSQPRPKFVLTDHLPPPTRLGVYNSAVLNEVKEAP
jgi:thiosulfate dehydrogenase